MGPNGGMEHGRVKPQGHGGMNEHRERIHDGGEEEKLQWLVKANKRDGYTGNDEYPKHEVIDAWNAFFRKLTTSGKDNIFRHNTAYGIVNGKLRAKQGKRHDAEKERPYGR